MNINAKKSHTDIISVSWWSWWISECSDRSTVCKTINYVIGHILNKKTKKTAEFISNIIYQFLFLNFRRATISCNKNLYAEYSSVWQLEKKYKVFVRTLESLCWSFLDPELVFSFYYDVSTAQISPGTLVKTKFSASHIINKKVFLMF